MVLFGTLINGLTIIVGSLFGLFFKDIQERYKETVIHGVALVVILIGIQMALVTDQIVLVLLSLLFGALLGEFLQLERRINDFANLITTAGQGQGKDHQALTTAFVTATLIFAVGAMAILGALDSGIRGDHEILITKSILDGFTALVLTTTLGYGVLFSAVPVVIYQGIIALLAHQIDEWIPEAIMNGMITELTAVGGLLIIAIALNLLNLTKIRISNLLPALFLVCLLFYIYSNL